MLAPVRQITDDTSSRIRTVCTWGCALIGQLSCRGNLRSEGPHVAPVLPWQQHDGGGRWLLTRSVCVCVRGRSLTPTLSTCKNQIVMKRTAVTSFPRVPLCPGILSVAVRLLRRVRHGVCGLTAAWCRMKSYVFTFILQTNTSSF